MCACKCVCVCVCVCVCACKQGRKGCVKAMCVKKFYSNFWGRCPLSHSITERWVQWIHVLPVSRLMPNNAITAKRAFYYCTPCSLTLHWMRTSLHYDIVTSHCKQKEKSSNGQTFLLFYLPIFVFYIVKIFRILISYLLTWPKLFFPVATFQIMCLTRCNRVDTCRFLDLKRSKKYLLILYPIKELE